ncbi:hypothetical protein Ptr86124_006454 [Pyrenophora tritici-repentis]|uniref:Uncharacterized protein n=1 Tax=Pyrenophora tritici-repentis TaxID=45151 RepID=A0A922NJF0_9PLEO|nr:hypothetical protein Ptr86124_006454 [Pyrenophora tritici-repentis]
MDTHSRFGQGHHNDHIILMWAVMTISRFNELFPSLEEANTVFRSIETKAKALRLRYRFDKVAQIFCSNDMDPWAGVPTEEVTKLFLDMDNAANDFYNRTAEGRQILHGDYEGIAYILNEFAMYLFRRNGQEQPDADGEVPIFRAIAQQIAEVLDDTTITSRFEAFNQPMASRLAISQVTQFELTELTAKTQFSQSVLEAAGRQSSQFRSLQTD